MSSPWQLHPISMATDTARDLREVAKEDTGVGMRVIPTPLQANPWAEATVDTVLVVVKVMVAVRVATKCRPVVALSSSTLRMWTSP